MLVLARERVFDVLVTTNAFPEGNVFSDLFVSANVIDPANTEAVWIIAGAPDYATYAANGGHRNSSIAFVLHL